MTRTLLLEGPSLTTTEFEVRLEWFAARAEQDGFTPADSSAVEDAVNAVLADRADFVKERGLGAIGPLMGMVMGKLGGSADGKIVSQTLKQKINDILED
jgi:glutamyl-tRNA(Gln) amidotransferase subunit E